MLLLFASLLLFYIYQIEKYSKASYKFSWLFLCIIFLFLALDEATQIHDILFNRLFKSNGLESDIFHYSWVIPYTLFVIGVGTFFLKFILRLEYQIRILFIISGIVYVSGALGCEFIEGYITRKYSNPDQANSILFYFVTVEEIMEMIGVAVFITALLKKISPKNEYIFISTTSHIIEV